VEQGLGVPLDPKGNGHLGDEDVNKISVLKLIMLGVFDKSGFFDHVVELGFT
jgi:hypothetical protein